MGPNEVSSPEMNLVIPWVPAGLIHKASGSAVDVPVSFQSGWVTTTSPVGSRTGPTVIVGHVNYADGSWAPMSNIHYAEPGMAIRVSDGAGGIETFTVASRTVVEQTRISDLVAFTTTGPRQLILITCGGPLENGIYTHNEVVVATPAVTR
jgi:sortase (surface protein transpeptidase)